MKKGIILLIIVILLISFSFADNIIPTVHCWRQDMDRSVGINVNFSGETEPSEIYDFILSPESEMIVSGIDTYNFSCDNGATGSTRNYVAIYDEDSKEYIATNVPTNKGPATSSHNACFTNDKVMCYIGTDEDGDKVYFPKKGTCGFYLNTSGGYYSIGAGTSEEIKLTFDKFGDRTISVRLGAVSPSTATSPNSPEIIYRTLGTYKLSIGKPVLLTFAPEKRRIISTFDDTGDVNAEFNFSLMNPSRSPIKLENYFINCPQDVDCILEKRIDGNKKYVDYILQPGQEMIISAIVSIDKSDAPFSFAVSMDFNYNGVEQNCGENNNPCTVSTEPAVIDVAYADQQDFQVEVKASSDVFDCVGEDGMIGQTGENFAPRINLSFGKKSSSSEIDSLISVNECDPILENGEPNPDWVYCSQEEFITSIAIKLGRIGEIREEIFKKEAVGDTAAVNALRMEEAKLISFRSYLRKQILSENSIQKSIENVKLYLNEIAEDSGLDLFSQDREIQKDRLEKLISAIEFRLSKENVIQNEKDLVSGFYQVKIDINELSESLQSNYLFKADGNLNSVLDIKVTVEPIGTPYFNWFFYDSNSNKIEEDFNLIFSNTVNNAYITNVSKRGIILEYTRMNTGEVEDIHFFKNYAAPLFLRLDSAEDGNTNGVIKIVDAETASNFNPNDGVFTYWTGFASSLGDGCTTITDGESALPYRVPDLVKDTQGTIELNSSEYSFMKARPNSKMYLETIFYMPKGKIMQLVSPMKLYTATKTCADAPPEDTNCTVTIRGNDSLGEIENLEDAFEGIKEGRICISKSITVDKETWNIFWNQNHLLRYLNVRKHTIVEYSNKDANICDAREILGG